MAIDRTGAGAAAPQRGRSAAEHGQTRLSCLARNAEGEAARQGKKVGDGRCGPGARGEAVPRPDWPITERNRSGRTEPGRTEMHGAPRRPPRNQDGSPRHQRRPPPTPVHYHRSRTEHDRPSRHRLTWGDRFHRVRPAWTGRRTKDGTRERALLGQSPHRIDPAPCHQQRRGRLHRRTNMVAPTDTEAPRREAGRSDPRSIEKARAERGDRTDGRMCPRAADKSGLTTGGGPLFGAC